MSSNEQPKTLTAEEREALEKCYETALKSEGWHQMSDGQRTVKFARLGSTSEISDGKIYSFLEEKLKAGKVLHSEDIRVRDTEYAILSTPRIVVGNEMEALREHSSGTGKTKLLADLKRDELILKDHSVIFISCLPKDTRRERKADANENVYDCYLNFNEGQDFATQLSDIVIQNTGSANNKVILLFDEAQELSRYGAQRLHELRRFLRMKREKQCIAFIAGTNQSLANCYPSEEQRKSSREGESDVEKFLENGAAPFPPMFTLFTMGLFASKIRFRDDASEFDQAIPYGRPLFARLMFDEDVPRPEGFDYPVQANSSMSNDELFIVATRMLIGSPTTYQDSSSLLPFISIWGTRVQLGSIHTAVGEELVAKGYAHLTSFHSNRISTHSIDVPRPTVGFAFMPDPVCARLAMCLMHKDWQLSKKNGDTIHGQPREMWTQKLKELFSSGLCRPSGGDLGELVSAAYLLFCGDVLRYEQDPDLKTFSVPVASWVSLLGNPGDGKKPCSTGDVFVNFIQFCRNDLRLGLQDVCKDEFLEYIYKSCCAVYADEGCPLYDAYGAMQCRNKEESAISYIPILLSIKTREAYADGKLKKNIDDMVKELYRIGQRRALVLVVILDREKTDDTGDGDDAVESLGASQEPPTKKPRRAGPSGWQQISTKSLNLPIDECSTAFVSRIIDIPSDDPFGLTDVVHSVTRAGDSTCVFTSHAFTGIVNSEHLVGRRKKTSGTAAVLTKESSSDDLLRTLWDNRYREIHRETNEMDYNATDVTRPCK